MRLLAPLGLAALGLVGPMVLWYVLRSRRPPRVVASTLWLVDEHETATAAIPWQPFSPDRTFWLVTLAVLLGALALARPAVAVPAEVGDHTIIVIDASASMRAATADGAARIEQAREVAADLLDRAGDGRLVSVVLAGSHAQVLLDTLPVRQATGVLGRVRADGTGAALQEAVTLASALIRPGEDTVMHVITDGGAGTPATLPAGAVVTTVGEPLPNLAIGAVRAAGLGPDAARVVVDLRSFVELPAVVRVTADAGAGAVVDTTTLTPFGGTDVELEVPLDLDVGETVVEVRIASIGEGPDGEAITDALAYDDLARAVVPAEDAVRVLHIGPDNRFLDAALAAIPGVAVRREARVPADLADVDLLVVDQADVPDGLAVPVLAVAPTGLPAEVTVTGRREAPTITRIETGDPLLADVALEELAVAVTDVVEAPGMRRLVDGPAGPLLLAGRVGQAPMVLLPFALSDSNLPLLVALPVLLSNVVTQLAAPPVDVPLVAGADRPLPLPAGVGAILTGPDGQAVRVDAARPSATLAEPGVWTVDHDGPVGERAATILAVNPDPGEADLRVAGDGSTAVPTTAADEESGGVSGEAAQTRPSVDDLPLRTEGRVELWPWLVGAAALLLAVEVAARAWSRRRPGRASRPGRPGRPDPAATSAAAGVGQP